MTTWLQKQRKADLIELADEAGLKGASNMKVDDLRVALHEHLTANAATLSSKTAFHDYYSTKRATSPIKREGAAALDKAAAAARRKTLNASAQAGEAAANAAQELAHRTPRAVQQIASGVPLPPSPAIITDMVDRQTVHLRRRVRHYWRATGLTPHLEYLRTSLSSVVAVETAFLAIESWGLRRIVLPNRHAFTIPGTAVTAEFPVSLPDFFLLVSDKFWGPATLWVLTSLVLPMVAGWFFNLSTSVGRRREPYLIDPLGFNVAKALIAWLVYSQGFSIFGFVDAKTAGLVNLAIPGGWFAIVIGSLTGALFTLYEAALRK